MSVYGFARALVNAYSKIFFRTEYIGRENEPEDGNYIAFSNHTSFNDPIFTACAVKKQISFIAKSTLAKNPFMNWLFRKCDVITINRGESDIHAMRVAVNAVEDGKVIAIYPQGTRQPDTELVPSLAQPGIGLIAKKTKAPLLPVTICYGKKKPRLFRKVRVYIGKPILPSEYLSINESPNSREISEYCFGVICRTFKEKNHG